MGKWWVVRVLLPPLKPIVCDRLPHNKSSASKVLRAFVLRDRENVMPNSRVAALMPLTGVNVTYGKGNDYRQLACGPVFAAGHVNAAIDSVVPTLSSLVGGSKV